MKIAIYGAGGVGSYFGGRLAQAGADVHLIARGDHLDAVQRDGLLVRSVHGDFHVDVPATDEPGEIGQCDYVLFTVKSFDTEEAAGELHPLLDDDTAVISLQNGLDNEENLAAKIGRQHVIGCVAYIFSAIADPGTIEHTGGPTSFTFGELDGTHSDRAERFLAWCDRAEGMDADISNAIQTDLWKKAAFICAHAGMTAAVRLPLGEIRSQPESWEMYRRIIDEVCTIGRRTGVELPDGTVSQWMDFASDLDADTYSSLHYDMIHGKPMELEALHGAIVQRARKNDVTVPMNEAVYAILRPWMQRNQQVVE